MKLSILSLVTACSALTLQICIYRRMIRAEQKPAEPEETPEPKNPDRNGMYHDHEDVLLDMFGVDEHGFLYTARPAPSDAQHHVFCTHMLDWCTDRCMMFEGSWNKDKTLHLYSFECRFHPFRYLARKRLRHMSHG